MSIEETWPRFLVSSVNGKQVAKPVDFRGTLVSRILHQFIELPDIRPAAGDVWELRGIEIGSYRGIPDAVYTEVFQSKQLVPAQPFRFGFYTELKYFSRRIVRHGAGENDPQPESPVAKAIREL